MPVPSLRVFIAAACIGGVLWGGESEETSAATPQTVASPVAVTTLDRLPLLPRNVTVHQFSSHNRKGLNADVDWFLYKDEEGDSVIFDAAGPGCVRSLWQTSIVEGQTLKFYFDGESRPRYVVSCPDFYRGKHPLFPPPLVSLTKAGYWGDNPNAGNCFVPIPFAKSLKISIAGPVGFYHVLYERYPYGTPVATFTGKEDRTVLLRAFAEQGEELFPPADADVVYASSPELKPGEALELLNVRKPGTVARIVLEGDASDEFLQDADIEMRWDGARRPDIAAPVGIFFGAAVWVEQIRSLPTKVERIAGDRVRLTSYFRMPFWRSARIALVWRPTEPVKPLGPITAKVHVTPSRYQEDEAGYFCTLYRNGQTEMGRDWRLFDAAGTGWYVGTVQTMHGAHYCEGDEHIATDGAGSPQINGTGTEDYYLACYWPNRNFNLPFAGCVGDIHQQPGPACYYRFHLDAPIPFYSALDARIEHGAMSNIVSHYRSLGFAYLRRRPALRQTDFIDIANEASERAHDYRPTRSTVTDELTTSYEGAAADTLVRDRGRMHTGGEITFTVAVDSAASGVRLRRRLDQNSPRQTAEVYVDGQYAGTWYHADHNPYLRWFDSDYDLPPGLTRGKSGLKIRLVPRMDELHGPFSDFRYEVLAFSE